MLGKIDDVEISMFYYEYPMLKPFDRFNSLSIASIDDIACMKLEAIAGRGLKRDFFDLYTICNATHLKLSNVLENCMFKFGHTKDFLPHLSKSLTYFVDAETKPERAQIVDKDWEKVKVFFDTQTPQALRELLDP